MPPAPLPYPGATRPPPALVHLAPGWTATLAYQLVPGVTTWRLTHPDGSVRFAKVDGAERYPSLRAEAERMVWAAAYLPVPTVVALEAVGESTVLVTQGLPGRDATDPVWRREVPRLVEALGRGLAAIHGAVGEEWCPFRFDIERALEHVRIRVETGDINVEGLHSEHAGLTPASALDRLRAEAPGSEDLVVCHGDYCPPNVLLTDGAVTGYVDLGELGVADRWWDISIGGWSVGWNFGEEFEQLFYQSYGIAADADRIRFYRLLYDLVS
ncbi:MAG TPA: aminoglycoside 3'-phosphotransferase [Acidimicrobiales bacterium]|nr:aminoglycoside 3'-phosphotransferase [Acidimicrobiales bacterium]